MLSRGLLVVVIAVACLPIGCTPVGGYKPVPTFNHPSKTHAELPHRLLAKPEKVDVDEAVPPVSEQEKPELKAESTEVSTPKQAATPRIEKTIGNLEVGETGWCVPWCADTDEAGRLWIQTDWPIHPERGGIVRSMKVTRTQEGYEVDISRVFESYRWDRLGQDRRDHALVASVITSHGTSKTLPERFKQRRLSQLKVGESAWTTPWTMDVDAQHKAWIDLKGFAGDSPGGTVSMRVTRTRNGFIVEVHPHDDYRWTALEEGVSPRDSCVPVVQVSYVRTTR